jgi:hypothetical protein
MAQPAQPPVGILRKDPNGSTGTWVYANITTQTTTLLKTGAGILHSITFNKPVATGTCEFDDALTHTSPVIGTITTPASPMPVTLIYDVEFTTGLSITTGIASQDITVAFS